MYHSLDGIMDQVRMESVGWALAYMHPLLCGHMQTATSGSYRCDFPSGRDWNLGTVSQMNLSPLSCFRWVNLSLLTGMFPKSLSGDSNVKPVLANY